MTKEAFSSVNRLILKECSRDDDLSELCEYWGVTTDDFDEFLELARKGFDAENAQGGNATA